MGKIETFRNGLKDLLHDGLRLRLGSSADNAARLWLIRATSSAVRAFLVMILVVLPSVILPDIGTDTKQIVALVALFAGGLVFFEYNAIYPSLIEFRDGAPYNRIRYLMLLATVLILSVIVADREDPTTVSGLVRALGEVVGSALDFPYSPVRLATLMLSDNGTVDQMRDMRIAAGMAYLVSLLSLAIFVIVLKMVGWPSTKSAFNVWVNLPTFEPTAGGDVVDRLERDSRVNLSVGFLLPFVVPALIVLFTSGLPADTVTAPQTLIWTISALAYLPASLLMRGVAMARIADMIRTKRDLKLAEEAGPQGADDRPRLTDDDDEDDDL